MNEPTEPAEMHFEVLATRVPPSSPPPPQFGLQAMFIALTIGSLWLAVFTWYGIHAAMVVVPFMFIAVFLESAIFGLRRWYLLGYAVFGMCVGMLWFASLNLQSPAAMRAAAQATQSKNNLFRIKIALKQYEDSHGQYPPIAMFDSSGTPQHSWRMLILGRLDRPDTVVKYDLTEPWDSPRNSKVKEFYAAAFFQSPVDPHHRDGITNYLAIVGPDYQPGDRFAVIELPATGIRYFEPRDVTLEELLARLHRPGLKAIPGAHDRGTRLRILWPDQEMELVPIIALPGRLDEVLTRRSRR